jgi:2-amino-4-hydroxy-6-hydroxymethyldihydropteridine diphosphokinase
MNQARPASQACLLLGSNIAPEQNLPRALALLSQHVEVADASLVWETSAVGSQGPDFLNAAVLVRTNLPPDLLEKRVLKAIEQRLGRVRSADKYAPRPIDIDLVAWDCQVTDPDVWRHAHAAVPVSEVLPCDTTSAAGETLAQAAQRLMQTTPIRPRGELALPRRLQKPTAH